MRLLSNELRETDIQTVLLFSLAGLRPDALAEEEIAE